jgi:hypothetical protein
MGCHEALYSTGYIKSAFRGEIFNPSTAMSEHEVKPYEHASTIPGRSLSKRVQLRELQKKGTAVEKEETLQGILTLSTVARREWLR